MQGVKRDTGKQNGALEAIHDVNRNGERCQISIWRREVLTNERSEAVGRFGITEFVSPRVEQSH